ncbi:MAG TPA: hypothetical protein VF633_08845 [Brevundimonas sp.]
MRLPILAIAMIALAACDGEDPVTSATREISTANHAAAAVAEAEAKAEASDQAKPPASATVPVLATECDVEITFGSACCGVDGDLRAKLLAVTSADPDVAESSEKRWGREGESTVCLKMSDPAAADRLYEAIATQLPSTSSKAPTTVRNRDGLSRATAYSVGR